MASKPQISTPLTKLFGIRHPVLLAGMNVAAGPDLAAAVTNAGGLGVIGGIGYTPKVLKQQIEYLKEGLVDKSAPFGVDLLLPQIGGNARKTNYDYTKGQLPQLVDVIIESGAKLFVCAVGVPPKEVVEKLHKAGIPVMNMIGHVKHVKKALDAGVDIICAQGGEGGGHTGDIPTSILIPAVVDEVKGRKSPLNGEPIRVVAAGGIYDGRGLAAALMWGADAVWVGTRFVASVEAGASKAHKQSVVTAGHDDNIRTIIFTGRPLRVRTNDYIKDWEENRQEEIKKLTSEGVIPYTVDLEKDEDEDNHIKAFLQGKVAAVVNDIKPAKDIVDEMVTEAARRLRQGSTLLVDQDKAKL